MNDFDEEILIQGNICKSISGDEDENGNYVFEVEASNENLDLQNQRTLQSALLKSKEYFLTNGVISDDHLHRVRNSNGEIDSHKDKIIGEPVSVRTDGKSTFVKGILYKGVAAAKPYIELLKNKSSRVKASIGGIMPKIRKNADGSETITDFMWNDLALTCSPVNWTVGSAKFAKSIALVDFCKSLNAGSCADAESFEGGRVLQNEDIEKDDSENQKMPEDEENKEKTESPDVKKSDSDDEESIFNECNECIDSGELKTKEDIENFFVKHGYDEETARDKTLEIIKQGGIKMRKSHFSSTISELLKSFDGDKESEKKDEKKEADEKESETLFEDEDEAPEVEKKEEDEDVEKSDEEEEEKAADEKVEKCGVKKSIEDESASTISDATDFIKSMGETIDRQAEEIESLKKSIEELQDNMIDVTKSLSNYLKTPNARATVISKSMDETTATMADHPSRRPTAADFDILKSALVKATKADAIGLEEVQYLNSQFQKSMNGGQIKPETWNKICSIVKTYR